MRSMAERRFAGKYMRRQTVQYRIHDKHIIFYQDVHLGPSQRATPARCLKNKKIIAFAYKKNRLIQPVQTGEGVMMNNFNITAAYRQLNSLKCLFISCLS
ncbi:hypothetical protein DA376_14375 [Bacillus velezensis]|nr:hypothetical protein A5891_13830 [Bacillus velezensis]ANU31184.1 hypothetical protein A8142_13700 [Bacillus velezensis]AQZ72325.1 hypothetical protein BLL65_04860 [Bacillus velezensis]ARN86388.1 hypothetical protein AAV34_05205 [Bacillus velezensis]AVV95050.1 hypothetical protein DA376_14375 [Bacillus velezensis]